MYLKKGRTFPPFLPGDTLAVFTEEMGVMTTEKSLKGEQEAGVKTQGRDGECGIGWHLFQLKAFSDISGNIVQVQRDLSAG